MEDPNCPHAVCIREDKAFYKDWLLPKIMCVCIPDKDSTVYFTSCLFM